MADGGGGERQRIEVIRESSNQRLLSVVECVNGRMRSQEAIHWYQIGIEIDRKLENWGKALVKP